MEQHGPTDLTGPVRGSSTWWQGTGVPPEAVPPEAVPPEAMPPEAANAAPNETASEKGKSMARRKRGGRRGGGDPIRPELVARVRQEIAAGTYDSPEKWEAALDRLLDRLQRD
jgi:negative regulator of flagellin synthesis FlgM